MRDGRTNIWERFRADITKAFKTLFASNITYTEQILQKLVEKVLQLARTEYQMLPTDNLTARLSQSKPRLDLFIGSLKEQKEDE